MRDSDDNEAKPHKVDIEVVQLLDSDTEDEKFDEFAEKDFSISKLSVTFTVTLHVIIFSSFASCID